MERMDAMEECFVNAGVMESFEVAAISGSTVSVPGIGTKPPVFEEALGRFSWGIPTASVGKFPPCAFDGW